MSSSDSIPQYSQVQFSMQRELTPRENELIDKVAQQIKLYAKNVDPTSSKSNIDKNTGEVIDVF